MKLAVRYRFQLPPYYTLIVRSLATLEGVALSADPHFKIVRAAFPIVLYQLVFDNRYVQTNPGCVNNWNSAVGFALSLKIPAQIG